MRFPSLQFTFAVPCFRVTVLCLAVATPGVLFSQVAINRDGTSSTDTTAMLEIKNATKSKLKVRSLNYADTAVLELSNRNTNNEGTDFMITARREQGLYFTTTSDLSQNINDSLLVLRTNGNIGIGKINPANKLDVAGNINVTGTIKANGVVGQPNQVLGTSETGNLAWVDKTSDVTAGNVGFGSWGDCSMNNVSEYCPVSDSVNFGDFFGTAVSLSGDYAFVGSYLDDGGAGADQGSVTIYRFDGTSWVFMQKIFDATGAAGDRFGYAVSISGNYAVVGAFADDGVAGANQGSASIYQFNGSSWVFMQKITDATGAAGDAFGLAVSISDNYIIIGSPSDDGSFSDQGSASIYQFNGSSWVFMQKVTDATAQALDGFGRSVCVSGNRVIVGADLDDYSGFTNVGSASIFQFNGASWTLMNKIVRQGLMNNDDYFGESVSIAGNFAVVGSPREGLGRGDVTIFLYHSGAWDRFYTLYDDDPGNNEYFGSSVSLSGDYLIIGVENDNTGVGAASIYRRIGMGWQKLQYMKDPGASLDYFGTSVSVDGTSKRFMVGAPNYPNLNQMGKVVFGKIN